MLPSSFMISQMTPAGVRPARRAKSTDASVWPARTRTPPSRARKGNTWPGRARSPGRQSGRMAVRMVQVRSAAEMPVVVPSRASIDSQNAVPKFEVFMADISGSRRASQLSGVSARQIRPRPWVAMKFTISGVTFSAAMVRSPSFSRSSSSTTTRIRPARISSIACGMETNGIPYSNARQASDEEPAESRLRPRLAALLATGEESGAYLGTRGARRYVQIIALGLIELNIHGPIDHL